jgi:hypothetical protein
MLLPPSSFKTCAHWESEAASGLPTPPPRLLDLGDELGAAELRHVVDRDRGPFLFGAVFQESIALVFDQVHQAAIAIDDYELLFVGRAAKQDFDFPSIDSHRHLAFPRSSRYSTNALQETQDETATVQRTAAPSVAAV